MIAAELTESRSLKDDIVSVLDLSSARPDVAELCGQLLETVSDSNFPGALVPVPKANGALDIYIAAHTMRAWRQLSPVLRAFAGPTLTSFTGITEPLPEAEATARIVANSNPAATAVMHVPSDTRSIVTALRALVRVRETFARAPDLQTAAPEPTSWLLARFQDNLNVRRRDAAAQILKRLGDELRLDALNIKFLEVQLAAAFEDWAAVIKLPGFASLCLARRPPAITALLLEALYQTHLAKPFEAGDREATREIYNSTVRIFAQPMLGLPVPPTLSDAGWKIYGLEYWIAPSRSDLHQAVLENEASLDWLAEEMAASAPASHVLPQVTLTQLDEARNALVHVEAVEGVDNLAAALAILAKLSPDQIARLREAEPFGSAMRIADGSAVNGVPSSWPEWLQKTSDPSFTNAVDIARLGKDEWSPAATRSDPSTVNALVAALNHAQSDPLASERTSQALPFLVAWLQRDETFPTPIMKPVYSSLLTLFALNSTRTGTVYESCGILVEALLEVGLSAEEYHALIADIDELVGEGFGVDMIYWVLDTIEAFMRSSTPDAVKRDAFLHSVLARSAPVFGRLSSLQQAAIRRLATELGWSLHIPIGVVDTPPIDDFANHMNGLRIAIYSLTEASSRQAKAALEEMVPSATVDCNSDHGGTVRLRALAENSDLFVVTWLSAKHAATDFIREHRGDRTLLYAQGRGFSSILRALEEHFSQK
ncbi:protein DpdD [Ensifer sp. R-19]|uniref:protein DpdD n=1 Tax=Ensifer sp. R-19 TaxID=3404055 RepID=UPI003CEA026B